MGREGKGWEGIGSDGNEWEKKVNEGMDKEGEKKSREGTIRNRKGRKGSKGKGGKEMERKRRKGIGRGEERREWKGRIGKANERGGSRQICLIRCSHAEMIDRAKGTYHFSYEGNASAFIRSCRKGV